jgi:hypothetical protein
MKSNMTRIVLLALVAATAAAQEPPEWQLNAPYRCANGLSYTITKRNGTGYNSICLYSEEKNGQHVTDVVTRCSQMTGMLQGCKVGETPSVQQGTGGAQGRQNELNDSRYDCANGSARMTVVGCGSQGGQDYCFVRMEMGQQLIGQFPKPRKEIESQMSSCKALPQLNPSYLAEFPAPYLVVQGMLVGNPRDNVVRAIGAFYQLMEILKVLAGQRGASGYSPDEKKFVDDYTRAQSVLVEAAAKKFPGEHFDVERNPFHYNVSDPKFGFEGIPVWTKFFTPGVQARFSQLVGHNDPRYQVAVDQERRRAIQQVDTDVKVAQADANAPKDAGSVAMRHCLESGRSEMECLGEGLKVGAIDLMGGNPLKGIVPETPVGLRLTGLYSAAGFGLQFSQDTVAVGCGKLVPQPLPYSVERTGNQILVKIPIAPRPLALSYKPDGSLAGPGPIDVAGRVVIGGVTDSASTSYQMQTQTATTQRQIDAGDVPNYAMGDVHQNGMEYSVDQQSTSTSWEPTTTHHYSVPTAPKTERCNVGTLPPTKGNISVSGALTQLVGSNASKSTNTAPGLRLNGKYAAVGGLKIEFRDDSATLECGESFSSEAYEVSGQQGQLVVKFQNSTGPLSLILESNGTLTGSGSIDVAGRKAIPATGGGVDYLPRNARCSLGTLEVSR